MEADKKDENYQFKRTDQLVVHLILLKAAKRSEAKSAKRSFASIILNIFILTSFCFASLRLFLAESGGLVGQSTRKGN